MNVPSRTVCNVGAVSAMCRAICLSIAALICLIAPAQADVDAATTWLRDNQIGGSYWGDDETSRLRHSATVVEVLRRLGEGGVEVTTGEAWLANAYARSHDDAARLLTALADAPYDVSGTMEELLAGQLSGAGWGTTGEYLSDPLDTALAIRALVAQGNGDSAPVQSGVSYLLGEQSVDGGWGLPPAGDSSIFLTSTVLLALEEQTAQDVSTAVASGVAWLSGQSNPDHGFGAAGNSTVSETALAYLAIIEIDPESGIAQQALSYLISLQDGGGSWNESAYETALGAWAMAASGPDLFALDEEISFVPPHPTEGDNVQITSRINNDGLVSASDVLVRFFNGSPWLGDVNRDDVPYTIADAVYTINILLGTVTATQEQLDASDVNLDGYPATVADVVFLINVLMGQQDPLGGQIGDDTLVSVPAGGFADATQVFNTTGHAGNNMIFVQIDPLDAVAESDETNNLASAPLFVSPSGPLARRLEQPSLSGPSPGKDVTSNDGMSVDLPPGRSQVVVWVRTEQALGGVHLVFATRSGVEFEEPIAGPLVGGLDIFAEAARNRLRIVLASFEGLTTELGEGVLLKIPLTAESPGSQLMLLQRSFSTEEGQLTNVDDLRLEVRVLEPSSKTTEETERASGDEGRVTR